VPFNTTNLPEVIRMAEPKQAKNGTWEFVFDGGRRPDGSRIQVRRRGIKSRREALNLMAKLRTEIIDGSYIDPTKVRVIDFMQEWFNERLGNVEPETYDRDYGLFKNHISKRLSNIEIQKVTPLMTQKLINKLNDELSASTVRIIYSLLRQTFKKAIYPHKLIKENPMDDITLPKKKKIPMKVWEENTIKMFIDKAKDLKIGHRYYRGYVIALLTGMRRGEILGLRWSDVDLENGLLYIRQIVSSQSTKIKDRTKTEAGTRTVSIPNLLIELLKEQKNQVEEEKRAYGENYQDNDLIICTLKGTPICPKNFFRTFKDVCKKLELPIIRFHDLRHSHVTLLIAKNTNPKIISERIGHSDIKVTLDTYSHILPSMQQGVVNTLDKIFED
jgi:integrase